MNTLLLIWFLAAGLAAAAFTVLSLCFMARQTVMAWRGSPPKMEVAPPRR